MNSEKNLQPVNLQLVRTDDYQDEINLYDIWCIFLNFKYQFISLLSR